MNRWVERFWVCNAVALGIWEALAVKTRRVPTISTTAALARSRWRVRTVAVIVTWAAGLVTYLSTKPLPPA